MAAASGMKAGRQTLAKMLALAVLFAQAIPAPMIPPNQALFEIYGASAICATATPGRNPASQPAQRCDACCWGQCTPTAAAIPGAAPLLHPPVAWNLRGTASPAARSGDRRILNAAQPRGPPKSDFRSRETPPPIRPPGWAVSFWPGLDASAASNEKKSAAFFRTPDCELLSTGLSTSPQHSFAAIPEIVRKH
ncbi:MAG TPA: hypothetical protein VM661_00320 [Candidatus Sulfotelmatobacter sp.]|jgi:hypothetical protein|nr:hypothetical protein [Candidatus Sulfotelmatobacter sp.]